MRWTHYSFLAVLALLILIAFALSRSLPQPTLTMAVYPEGTRNAELAKRYQEILARNGINLKLVPSTGAVESLARLRDAKSGVSVAIAPGGITTEQEFPELVSLGTLFYQPLWIFSHDHLLQRHGTLRGLSLAVGLEGSSSRALALKFLGAVGFIDLKTATLLSLAPTERAQKLINHEVDLAFFLDAWDGPAVQQLLKNKDVTLESIPTADAFVALYPFLDKLTLPAGVIDLAEPRPAADVPLISTTSSLVVRKDLHPAIQYRLLQAAVEIHARPGIFHNAGQFPATESIDLPLSPNARQFYKNGMPFVHRYLPFRLAALVHEPLLWLIPLVVIVLPLVRFGPAIYDWAEKRRVYRLYSELKAVEDSMMFAASTATRQNFIEQLNRLEGQANHLSVPTPFRPLVYALKLHIDMVRQEAQRSFRGSATRAAHNGITN
jgi:TRAP-type uncharacterized transport system substrate-binding protein